MSDHSGDGGGALVALIIGLSILAALAHIEKAINHQSDMMAHEYVSGGRP